MFICGVACDATACIHVAFTGRDSFVQEWCNAATKTRVDDSISAQMVVIIQVAIFEYLALLFEGLYPERHYIAMDEVSF